MPSRLLAVTSEADDPATTSSFWGRMLERTPAPDGEGVLLAGDDTQVGLAFVPSRGPRRGPALWHLHLTSADPDDQQRTIDAALALGATHLDVGQRPEEGHVVLADPGGAAFCVIEPGNRFLAGCGRLGEVACDGGRAVGVFWSEALGWPLVWDQDDETAVQSPAGGTKVAWGGAPDAPRTERAWQGFDLVSTHEDLDAEADRLVALGATVLARRDGVVELADPVGAGISLRRR